MRLHFDATTGDDDTAFFSTRDRLLGEFAAWLDGRGITHDTLVANASMFLDWRYQYSSGELDRFGDGDLGEFLLEWCPRKYSAPPEAALDVARAVAQFIEFLFATDRLAGGSDRAARLITVATDLAPEAMSAMGDPRNFGMAKSMFAGSGFDLPETDDLDELQSFLNERMAEFNALPFEERRAQTDRFFAPPEPEPIDLPYVHVPASPDVLSEAAAAAPILTQIEGLRGYLGDEGKTLTDTGNLRLIDGRALVVLLETGDVVDPAFGDRTFKTRSTDQLRNLRLVVDVAKAAKAVRVHRRRLVPVKAWGKLDPVARAKAAFEGIVDGGPLTMRYRGGYFKFDPIAELVDDGMVALLVMLLADDEVPFDELAGVAREAARAEIVVRGPYWTEESIGQHAERDVASALLTLEAFGVLGWPDRIESTSEYGSTAASGGNLSLTPVGRELVADLAETVGFRFRRLDDLSDATAETLVDVLATLDVDPGELLATWRCDLDDHDRAAMVAGAVANADNGAVRLAGLAMLDRFDLDVAGPAVRQLLDTPAGGHAAAWLLTHDLIDPEAASGFIGIGVFVDVLASTLDDPDEVCRLFLGDPSRAERVLEEMWRYDSPDTAPVLESLAAHLADKRLAKAVRKALFRHHSWMANRHR